MQMQKHQKQHNTDTYGEFYLSPQFHQVIWNRRYYLLARTLHLCPIMLLIAVRHRQQHWA